MKKTLLILTITLLSCSKTNEHNFIDNEKDLLSTIILRDISFFNEAKKDTLWIKLNPTSFCGNDLQKHPDCHSLFPEIKTQALKYGFKKVLEDTFDLFTQNYKTLVENPHFDLLITATANSANIHQSYTYLNDSKLVQCFKDTVIEF